jgi:hypothetical protein
VLTFVAHPVRPRRQWAGHAQPPHSLALGAGELRADRLHLARGRSGGAGHRQPAGGEVQRLDGPLDLEPALPEHRSRRGAADEHQRRHPAWQSYQVAASMRERCLAFLGERGEPTPRRDRLRCERRQPAFPRTALGQRRPAEAGERGLLAAAKGALVDEEPGGVEPRMNAIDHGWRTIPQGPWSFDPAPPPVDLSVAVSSISATACLAYPHPRTPAVPPYGTLEP